MNILYFFWDEFNGEDCQHALKELGNDVKAVHFPLSNTDFDDSFEEKMIAELGRGYDCVFSFNYFPIISRICDSLSVPYISWVYDCPHLPLNSITINNSVNHIYLFDRVLCRRLRETGINTIHHCPLAVNSARLNEFCLELDKGSPVIYEHDISFLGNLYDNEFNFYDQISYLPEQLREYIETLINTQSKIFGIDLFSDEKIFPDFILRELHNYIRFEKSGNYNMDYDQIIRDILRRKVTVIDRRKILTFLGKSYNTVLYSTSDAKPIENVPNLGLADYMNKMPRVFHRSRINLNITLRSIISGIPLRVLDILAAGGFLITDFREEIAEHFINGEDVIFYSTAEELHDKCGWFLSHDKERKKIAVNGMNKCRENFDYKKILPEILKI